MRSYSGDILQACGGDPDVVDGDIDCCDPRPAMPIFRRRARVRFMIIWSRNWTWRAQVITRFC
jgi:hypothetical protein